MQRYLISFDDGSMDHISEADLPAVGDSAHAVVRDAKAAGVWIFGGGILRQQSIIEVSSRADALAWAARFARACRCAQEVREIMFDPES